MKTTEQQLVTIVETGESARRVLRWHKQKNAPLMIIALSLDARLYLQTHTVDGVTVRYVWDMVDMDALLCRSSIDAEKYAHKWTSYWEERGDAFCERAIEFRLGTQFFDHILASVGLAEQLVKIFRNNDWVYCAPPVSTTMHGPYIPFKQKNIQHNSLFVFVFLAECQKHHVSISHMSRTSYFYAQVMLRWRFVQRLLSIIARNGAWWLLAVLTRKKSLRGVLASRVSTTDLLCVGWGRELSRTLSLTRFEQSHASSEKVLSAVHTIWRPKKLKLEDAETIASAPESMIHIPEHVVHNISFGVDLWFLGFSGVVSYAKQLVCTLRSRFLILFRDQHNDHPLSSMTAYSAVRYHVAYTMLFGYHLACSSRVLTEQLVTYLKPAALLGSDSGGVPSRSELLVAKAHGMPTWSTPHGYQAYAPVQTTFSFLADHLTQQGAVFQKTLEHIGVAKDRLELIGTAHPMRVYTDRGYGSRIRVVIGVRSRIGLWSNISSRHDAYDTELRSLLDGLLKMDERIDVVIKSHPNGDYHEYYDQLIEQIGSPRIQHIQKGWRLGLFESSCDVLICVGESPSLFPSSLYLGIPLVFIHGTMSQGQKHLDYHYDGCAIVSPTAKEACAQLELFIKHKEVRKQRMEKQAAFAKQFSSSRTPEKNLLTRIAETL